MYHNKLILQPKPLTLGDCKDNVDLGNCDVTLHKFNERANNVAVC